MSSPKSSEQGLLDALLVESRLYATSDAYRELLDFVAKLRAFAPFNAMLLHIQKPGLSFAATERDWKTRFGRTVKSEARPLLILWPFAPVALVYDILDTEGKEVPKQAIGFAVEGSYRESKLKDIVASLARLGIFVDEMDRGAYDAGLIRRTAPALKKKPATYQVKWNRNYSTTERFATLMHELAHLWLGHLGADEHLKIPDRSDVPHAKQEFEAESVAYILCRRVGVKVRSEQYLWGYLEEFSGFGDAEIHRILQVAGQLETRLGLLESYEEEWLFQDPPSKPVMISCGVAPSIPSPLSPVNSAEKATDPPALSDAFRQVCKALGALGNALLKTLPRKMRGGDSAPTS